MKCENIAILDLLNPENTISDDIYLSFYIKAEDLSKMLFPPIRELVISKK